MYPSDPNYTREEGLRDNVHCLQIGSQASTLNSIFFIIEKKLPTLEGQSSDTLSSYDPQLVPPLLVSDLVTCDNNGF